MNPIADMLADHAENLAVVPVMIGPLQALMAVLPGILAAVGGMLLAMFHPSAIKRLGKLIWAQKIPLVIAVAAIWGLVHLVGQLLPDRGPQASEAVAGTSDWTQFRGSPQRTGHVVDGHDDPIRGGVNWSFSLGETTHFYSSPTVVGNRVYTASALVSMFNREGVGHVFCFDADTGAEVWRGGPSGYRATFSSPAIQGNRLAIGEGLHEARDSRVMVMDLDRDGAVMWTYRTNSHTESSPVFHKGRVYFGAGQDGYYAFEIEPDADGQPQMVWHVPGERYPDASGSPGAYEDWVIVPMGRWGGNAIAALDADTGEEVWRIEAPYPVFSGPTIAAEHGLLLIGMGTGNFIQTAEEALPGELERLRKRGFSEDEVEAARENLGPAGEVWAIDLETQEIRWRYRTQRTVIAQVAYDGSNVYAASRDGQVHRIDIRSGERLGLWDSRDAILASPAVADDHLYIVTNSGILFALDKRRMTPIWDEPLGGMPSISSPTVARGRVFVGTTGNGLLSLGTTERLPETPVWSGDRGGPARAGWEDGSLLAARGSYAWGYQQVLAENGERAAQTAPLAALTSATDEAAETTPSPSLFVPWSDGERHALTRLDFADGVDRAPEAVWRHDSRHPITTAIVAVGSTVFALDGESGDQERLLQALSVASGQVLWQETVAADADGTLLATERFLLASLSAGSLRCFNLDANSAPESSPVVGPARWSINTGTVVGSPLIDGDLVLLASDGPPRLTVLDLWDGTVLWQQNLTDTPATGPVLAHDRIWIGEADGVHSYDLFTGAPLATIDDARAVDRLVVNHDHLAWTTASGTTKIYHVLLGEMVAELDGVQPVYAPLLSDAGLLLWIDGALQRYDFETGERAFWGRLTAAWPGLPETPPVMIERHLLFGSSTRRLVSMKMEN